MNEVENENSLNDESLKNGNQMNQYYHNAKALENVLKEDKEAHEKLEVEKQTLLERKQKVASYSKLVKEIHWDKYAPKKDKYEYLAQKKKSLKQNLKSNKMLEDNKSSKMMAVDKIKDMRKKNTERHQRSAQEQGELTHNYSDSYDNPSIHALNKSHSKPIEGLSKYGEYDIEGDFPKSSKNEVSHNFVGAENGKGKNKI
jgi:hypothetical protein